MNVIPIQYSCFLISAFGNKPLLRDTNETVNFDEIYHEIRDAVSLYKETHPQISFVIKRSDDYAGAIITQEFYQQLFKADLVIAEVSSPNLNVYYELGIRMALKRQATIILALERTPLPFDIKDLRIIFYTPGKIIEEKLADLHRLMEVRLGGENDSPVFAALPDLQMTRKAEVDELLQQLWILQGITNKNTYGIKITYPKAGEEVGEWTTVTGTFETPPPHDSLKLFNKSGLLYWPQPPPITLNSSQKTWEGKFHLGGKPPEEGTIIAAIIGNAAKALCEYFEWAGDQSKKWPAIKKLTDDVIECDSVNVIKPTRFRRFWIK